MIKFISYIIFCVVLFTVGWVAYPPDNMASTILCVMAHIVALVGATILFVGINRK